MRDLSAPFASALLLTLFAIPALAQAPEIAGILPGGGPRGETTLIHIDGKNLVGAQLHLSGEGVVVKSVQVPPAGDQLNAELTVTPSASFGPHELRISTPKGASNGTRFWVDLYPNRVITASPDESAPPLALERTTPIVLNGRIGATAGRHRFVFSALAGETWVFECRAARIHSRFDPVLELHDEAGESLKLVQSTWESDPRFAFRFPKAGRYLLTVRDSEYHGGLNHTYRLLVGRMPFLTGYLPLGGRPGSTLPLSLEGSGLELATANVIVPKASSLSGEEWAAVPLSAQDSTLIPLQVDLCPVVSVADSDTIQPLPTLPVALDGVFAHYARSRFSFHATSGEKLRFDLLGRRIGSRIDGELRVTDASGKMVASNDDAIGKDARLEFDPPVAGLYTLEARNVEEKTGPDCFYRLSVGRIAPDFRISLKTDRLNLHPGESIALPVSAERSGGFNGPIEVNIAGLPPTLQCSGGTIGPGKESVEVTLTAAADAALVGTAISVVGQANIAGKTLSHAAPGWEQYEHRSIDLTLSVEFSYARPHYEWDLLLAAVCEPVAAFSLTLEQKAITLAPGSKIEIPIHIERRAGATGEIALEARNLPAKVTAMIVPIRANQTDTKLLLTAAPDASTDFANVLIQGKLGNATQLAPALRLHVGK